MSIEVEQKSWNTDVPQEKGQYLFRYNMCGDDGEVFPNSQHYVSVEILEDNKGLLALSIIGTKAHKMIPLGNNFYRRGNIQWIKLADKWNPSSNKPDEWMNYYDPKNVWCIENQQ